MSVLTRTILGYTHEIFKYVHMYVCLYHDMALLCIVPKIILMTIWLENIMKNIKNFKLQDVKFLKKKLHLSKILTIFYFIFKVHSFASFFCLELFDLATYEIFNSETI